MARASTGDLHGTDGTTMWLSAGAQPNWIQYQFDKVYKLNDLKVWNSNQLIEGFLGFGAKKVTIEYSADGTTWTALDNVPEFARATGMAGYAANTTVNLGGVMAKFVKLTINSNWGGVAPQTGLSEVRFSYCPGPGPRTAAGDRRHGRRGRCQPELAAGPRGRLAYRCSSAPIRTPWPMEPLPPRPWPITALPPAL